MVEAVGKVKGMCGMSEGMFSAVLIGAMVEQHVAEWFKEAVEPYSTEDVIKSFIYEVANGHVVIRKKDGVI